MTNAKHTPGPWVYAGYDNDVGDDDGAFWEWWAVVDVDQNPIADVKSGEANAHLIAAAPELLALADLVLEIDVDGAGLWDAQQAARAAIAKAKGETT